MSVPGSNIRLLREQRGLSLRSLATAADVDVSVLSKLERGLGGYSREAIERIARELDVSIGMLFAEPVMVEAAALRMRRVPLLSPEQLLRWKGNDGFEADEGQVYLHIDLQRGSRNQFALIVTDAANDPEIRRRDVLVFDASKTPKANAWVAAQDERGAVFIGRLRILRGSASDQPFEVFPIDMAFPIGESVTRNLRLRGTLVELRRPYSP